MKAFCPVLDRAVDFFAFDATSRVYNAQTGQFVSAVLGDDDSLAPYRLLAVHKGLGVYEGIEPSGTATYQLRLRGDNFAGSPCVAVGEIVAALDFAALEGALAALELDVTGLVSKTDAVSAGVGALDGNLNLLAGKVDEARAGVDTANTRLEALEALTGQIEDKVGILGDYASEDSGTLNSVANSVSQIRTSIDTINDELTQVATDLAGVKAKIDAPGTPGVIIMPAPVFEDGEIVLVPVVLDAYTFGIRTEGAQVTLSFLDGRPINVYGHTEVPATLVITTKLQEDGKIYGIGYVYPSSALAARGYKEKYILDSVDVRIKRRLVTIPDEAVLVSSLIEPIDPLPDI